jgi:hypothetical protein
MTVMNQQVDGLLGCPVQLSRDEVVPCSFLPGSIVLSRERSANRRRTVEQA